MHCMKIEATYPKRRGWVLEIRSEQEVFQEREWQRYADATPAQRIGYGEELRRMAYGDAVIEQKMAREFTVREL